MIHITQEGGVIRKGFNFYPLGDTGSVGFRLRYGSKIFWFRYSRITQRWTIENSTNPVGS